MEEQRRIAAIRAKEEQLAREEKRIWEERIRQEAVLLAEKQKLIERERMREGEGFAGGLQDGQDGFKRKNDSQDEAHDRLVCCPKCDNITDARTCEVCGRALNPQLDNKVKYYTGHASLKTILLLRQHKIEEWTHKRERGVIMRGLDVICGLWPLWLILSMSGACLWLLLYWRHLLEME